MKSGKQKKISDSAIILNDPKYPHNVATIIRACSCFGVKNLLWSGDRVDPGPYDRLPREERMKGYKDVSWKRTDRPFDMIEKNVTPVCVELVPGSQNLVQFKHPENAVYVFGPEDGSVQQTFRRFCHHFVFIPAKHCLNLSAAVNIILFHRQMQMTSEWASIEESLMEQRGEAEIDDWSGQSWSEFVNK